ncbi:MAG: DDE transposase [Candidatus Nitrosocaldaceae archaeon]|nr:MAG: DDE transposase [Candidatus Nitrosocaldaceae archaeon]GIU72466.1 MAG: DDE transposase [Candidatus Nitrosocaldaceae archaeon]
MLVNIAKVIHDEDKAIEWLIEKGLLKRYDRCIYCNYDHIGMVKDNCYRCHRCKKEWSIRKDSILYGLRIPFTKFIMALKLFELEIPVLKASKELGLSYTTTHKIYQLIREKIYDYCSKDDVLQGEVEIDEAYFGGKSKGKRGRGSNNKIPVFGILERNGKVKVEIVKDVKAETILRETIKKVKRGSIIYTDKYKGYDTLVLYGFKHERIDKSIRFANGRVYINGIEGFWSYAKERLLRYHGVSKELFPYYLKELEFRYNNRDDVFDKMIEVLVGNNG